MRRADVSRVQPGDHITLYYNLGKGKVVEVLNEPDPARPNIDGAFPVIRYEPSPTLEFGDPIETCTYLMVKSHTVAGTGTTQTYPNPKRPMHWLRGEGEEV